MTSELQHNQPFKNESGGGLILRVDGLGKETYRNRNNVIEEVIQSAGTDSASVTYRASGMLAYPFWNERTSDDDTWHFSMIGKVTSTVSAGSGTVTEVVDFAGTAASGSANFQSMLASGTQQNDIVMMFPVQKIDKGIRTFMGFPAGGTTNTGECKITGYAGSGGAGSYVNGSEQFFASISAGYGAVGDSDNQVVIVSNRAGSAFGNIIPVGVRLPYTKHASACGARFVYEKPGIIG